VTKNVAPCMTVSVLARQDRRASAVQLVRLDLVADKVVQASRELLVLLDRLAELEAPV